MYNRQIWVWQCFCKSRAAFSLGLWGGHPPGQGAWGGACPWQWGCVQETPGHPPSCWALPRQGSVGSSTVHTTGLWGTHAPWTPILCAFPVPRCVQVGEGCCWEVPLGGPPTDTGFRHTLPLTVRSDLWGGCKPPPHMHRCNPAKRGLGSVQPPQPPGPCVWGTWVGLKSRGGSLPHRALAACPGAGPGCQALLRAPPVCPYHEESPQDASTVGAPFLSERKLSTPARLPQPRAPGLHLGRQLRAPPPTGLPPDPLWA